MTLLTPENINSTLPIPNGSLVKKVDANNFIEATQADITALGFTPGGGGALTAGAGLGYVDLQLGNLGLNFATAYSVYLAPCSGYLVVYQTASINGGGASVSVGTIPGSQPNLATGASFSNTGDSSTMTTPVLSGIYFRIDINGAGAGAPVPTIKFYPTDASVITTINYDSTGV